MASGKSWLVGSRVWLVSGLAVSALLVMREASALLGQLQAGGVLAYDMGAFTGPRVTFWDIRPLADAIKRWQADPALISAAAEWVRAHGIADAVFTCLYSAVLLWVLRRWLSPGRRRWAWILSLSVFVADQIENLFVITYVASALDDPVAEGPTTWVLRTLGTVTALKWVALLGAVVVTITGRCARALNLPPGPAPGRPVGRPTVPAAAAAAASTAIGQLQTLGRARVLSRLRVQVVVVLVFALVAAVPGGGPIEQLTDVLRGVFDGTYGEVFAEAGPTVLALAVLVWALHVSGRGALLDAYLSGKRKSPTRPQRILLVSLALLGAALVSYTWRQETWATAGMFALPLVGLTTVALNLLLGGGRQRGGWPSQKEGAPPDCDPVRLIDKPTGAGRDVLERAIRVLSALPVVLASFGLVRAFAGPALLTGGRAWLLLAVGLVGSVVGGTLTERFLHMLEPLAGNSTLARGLTCSFTAVLLVLLALMALDPIRYGGWWQLNGVIALVLAGMTLVLGFVRQRTEVRLPQWWVWRLRLGRRSPIFALGVVVFLLAGQLDTTGGYHDVRLVSPRRAAAEASPARVGNAIESHWGAWKKQIRAATSCRGIAAGRSAVPLVLVAAPGGGIRAAYWTASALDALTEAPESVANGQQWSECVRRSIFAVSGVSGGSLGIATWLSVEKGELSRPAVERMAEPGPLSADGAALLLRDLPRSITGVNPSWEDRAGVLERAWEKAEPGLAKTFDSVTAPVAETWRPIVLFNSTAVESGCRILVSQADATVSQTPVDDCRSPAISTDPQRFAAAAIDARDFLVDRTSLDGRSCVQEARAGSLTMATAAHLSARFTYVSPSGTMVGCSPRSLEMPSQDADAADRSPVLTSGIDGGYLENSGLQLLLQLWETLEPRVDRWNAESANGFKVIPIVVLTDNHYQSPAAQAAPRRRPELLVPLRGVNAPRVAMSTSIWEQHAVLRFAGAPPGMDDGVCWSNAALCRRVFRIAPDVRPQVSAPLGWSLSETSRENLDGQLTAQFKAAQAPQIGSLRGYDYRLLMHRLLDTSVG